MKRANYLTAVTLCLALVVSIGCRRGVKPAPKPEPKPVPTVGLVAAADAAETRYEARLRFDAAQMLEDGATLREARDWLAEHWPNAQFEASVKLREAERDTIKEPADAIKLWRQWAAEADPKLKVSP